jgi:putative hydrolase of the HAD superfamily
MIKAVLFDLDETLILRSGAIRAFIADQYRRFAADLGALDGGTYTDRFLTMEDNGRIPKDKLYPEFVAALGITGVDAETLLEDYRSRYPGFASPAPGACETVRAIHAEGIRTGILTNGNERVQQAKIDAIGLRDVLDIIVISEAVGLKKPDKAIFRLTTDRLGIAPAATLFVGDNPETDIIGAAQAGLQTAWFRNGTEWPADLLPRADADIDRLDEVLSFTGK